MGQSKIRRMLLDAAAGMDAINAFVEHMLAKADALEDLGDPLQAEQVRECMTSLWDKLNGCPRALIAAELHEAVSPDAAPALGLVPA